jgi:hypothetical protein
MSATNKQILCHFIKMRLFRIKQDVNSITALLIETPRIADAGVYKQQNIHR